MTVAKKILYRVDKWSNHKWVKIRALLAIGPDQAMGRVFYDLKLPTGVVLRAVAVETKKLPN